MRLRTRLFTAAAVGGALIAPLVPVGSVAPAGAVSTDTIDAAVAFLDTKQQADGGFESVFPGFETPDAVFALASAGQTDETWSAAEARAAVTSPTFTTTGGTTPLDAIDDWTDGVQGGAGSAASKSAQAAKAVVLVAAPLGLSAPDGLAATDFDPSSDTAMPRDLVAAIEVAAGTGDYASVPIAARAYVALALDVLGRPVPTGLTDGLIAAQQADGGYNFDADPTGTGVDPDVTALVTLALVASGSPAATAPTIRRAVLALGATQAGDGQWATDFDGPNPNSTAVVMLLGAAIGADPSTSCWRDQVEPGLTGVPYPSPAAALEDRQTPDGNISSPSDGFGVNTFATSQSIQALAAVEGAVFYRVGSGCFAEPAGNDRRLVNSLYVDVLGRTAEPGGAEYWTGQISSGLRPALVAKRFTGTPEYGRAVTSGLVLRYLGRPATTGEAQSGASAVMAGQRFALAASILGGEEYYDSTAPDDFDPSTPDIATDESWGAALYADALGREQGSGDQDFVEDQLAAGRTRAQLARTLLLSAEGRSATVGEVYEDLLRRQPDDGGLAFWTGRLKQGVSPELLVTQFVGSAEYRTLTAA